MNREALLVYLHDLRDLEVAKYQIGKINKRNYYIYQTEIKTLDNRERYKEVPKKNYLDILMVGVIELIVAVFACVCLPVMGDVGDGIILLCKKVIEKNFGVLSPFVIPVLIIINIFLVVYALLKYLQYSKEYREVDEYNKEESCRIRDVKNKMKIIINRYQSNRQQFEKELQKVSALLEDAYSLNLLAKPYRNLPSVYYIYEYMSTSQASLKETVMHAQIENGFQRIEKKLDIIINQNEDIIFATRRIEANTAKTVEQTTEMLENLQKSLESQERTEKNT